MDSQYLFYQEVSGHHVTTEEDAVDLLVKIKKKLSKFVCYGCSSEYFYQHKNNPEVFECKSCSLQNRIRKNTIMENSKISLVKWIKAIKFIVEGKRGISALEVQRHLKFGSYNTAWGILQKIRLAMHARDENYTLTGTIELDASCIGSSVKNNDLEIFIAVETKTFIDSKGKEKKNAGFAKVFFQKETRENAQKIVDSLIEVDEIHTDAAGAYVHLTRNEEQNIESKVMSGDKAKLKTWLPWVFAVTQNIKTWLNGTHHGVLKKYAKNYISEYIYRFNRRHDMDNLPARLICHSVLGKYNKLANIRQTRIVACV